MPWSHVFHTERMNKHMLVNSLSLEKACVFKCGQSTQLIDCDEVVPGAAHVVPAATSADVVAPMLTGEPLANIALRRAEAVVRREALAAGQTPATAPSNTQVNPADASSVSEADDSDEAAAIAHAAAAAAHRWSDSRGLGAEA